MTSDSLVAIWLIIYRIIAIALAPVEFWWEVAEYCQLYIMGVQ
jgi:hypothetical protein